MTGPLPSDTIRMRQDRVRALLGANSIDALLISQPENRFYLSGFTGSAGWLLISEQHALLVTDFRYYEQVELECPDWELIKLPQGTTLAGILPDQLRRLGAHRLGFEADHATYADVQRWSKALPDGELVPTNGLIAGLRAVKDDGEVAALRSAVRLADEAIVAALAQARPGMTEIELAWLIESYMRTHGAEAAAFDIIVAGGPNGARPHARASRDLLVPGEPIVIDMGARLGHYCSDLTRTVCFGEPNDPDRFWRVYNTVLAAQTAAEAGLRPGITGQQADALARDLIAEAGYGEYFGHGLGHGLGLAVHEEPRLSGTNPSPLAPGNVVTVEPGIYLPGWGGVRIEDVALITEHGVEILTGAPKDPIVLI